jgi:hypothetical protein
MSIMNPCQFLTATALMRPPRSGLYGCALIELL